MLENNRKYTDIVSMFFTSLQCLSPFSRSDDQAKSLETRTLAGRRRLHVAKYPEALNTPIQGTGGDGIKLALARLYEIRYRCPTAQLVACIHDELVVEAPRADADQVVRWVEEMMVWAMDEIVGGAVRIEVETQIAKDWAGTPLE